MESLTAYQCCLSHPGVLPPCSGLLSGVGGIGAWANWGQCGEGLYSVPGIELEARGEV